MKNKDGIRREIWKKKRLKNPRICGKERKKVNDWQTEGSGMVRLLLKWLLVVRGGDDDD